MVIGFIGFRRQTLAVHEGTQGLGPGHSRRQAAEGDRLGGARREAAGQGREFVPDGAAVLSRGLVGPDLEHPRRPGHRALVLHRHRNAEGAVGKRGAGRQDEVGDHKVRATKPGDLDRP